MQVVYGLKSLKYSLCGLSHRQSINLQHNWEHKLTQLPSSEFSKGRGRLRLIREIEFLGPGVVARPLILALKRQGQVDLCIEDQSDQHHEALSQNNKKTYFTYLSI